jgi:hypothetical protein
MCRATCGRKSAFVVALILAAVLVALGGAARQTPSPAGAFAGTIETIEIDFEDGKVDEMPRDFRLGLTGPGKPGVWIVQADAGPEGGEKVLGQMSIDPVADRLPLCIYNTNSGRDVQVSVAFKPLFGAVAQAGGLVIRLKDDNNYYVVAANALDNSVRFYKVIDGQRTQLASKDVQVEAGVWQTLSITASDEHFTIDFKGQTLFEVDDASLKEAGKIGLWTQADSMIQFDELGAVIRNVKP